jgi:hypothetical protein
MLLIFWECALEAILSKFFWKLTSKLVIYAFYILVCVIWRAASSISQYYLSIYVHTKIVAKYLYNK